MSLVTSIPRSLTRFAAWLPLHPATKHEHEHGHSDVMVRHHVARYCDFLGTGVSLTGDPLKDRDARDHAVGAYRAYLKLFNTAATSIGASLQCIDRFYVFLGLGPIRHAGAIPAEAPDGSRSSTS